MRSTGAGGALVLSCPALVSKVSFRASIGQVRSMLSLPNASAVNPKATIRDRVIFSPNEYESRTQVSSYI